MAAPSTYIKNNHMGVITAKDGSGNSLVVPYDKGDMALTGLGARLNETAKYEARGKYLGTGYTVRRYPQLSFSAFVSNLVGATAISPGSVLEFLTGLGAYAANISTQGTGRPYQCDIEFSIEGTAFGDASDEVVTLNDCEFTADFSEAAEGNSLSFSAMVLGPIVITNGSNTVTFAQIGSPTP